MTPSRLVRLGLIAVLVIAIIVVLRWRGTPQPEGEAGISAGGRLVATFRTEPTNFNRLVVADPVARLTGLLTQATLLRTDPATGDLEPRLATDWTGTPDGLTWTMNLRRDVRFSDGTPFTAADVLFTFRALYDERVGSPLGTELRVNTQPLMVRALDDHQIVLIFPAPFGPGLAILENLPILPRHKLEAALGDGTFRTAWAATMAPSDLVGLGPFVLKEYAPGQRVLFGRNPHFWNQDADGRALPYLDEIDLVIVPEQNAELLRLQSGEADLIADAVRAEDLTALREAEAAGRLQLVDAGVAIDVWTFWFNLVPNAPATAGRPWLTSDVFRRAVSHAINRQAIVDTVYFGAATPAYGPVTPGHGPWYVPDLPATPFDQGRARTLLTSIGLEDRNGDGVLEDTRQQPVRFSIITRRGEPDRERTIAVVQEQLRLVGVAVDIVALTQPEIIQRYTSGDFDAIYFGARSSSRDPIANMSFWLSSGPFHFWHPGQTTPATEWEARIDTVMQQQATTIDPAERRQVFAEAQRILADHLPALWLVAPHVTIPMSARVRGATPVIFAPSVLWNAEQIHLAGASR